MSREIGVRGRPQARRSVRGAVVRHAALTALLLAATGGAAVAAPGGGAVGKAAVRDFANPATITITDLGPASPYPSAIPVSGLLGSVTDVDVTLNGLTHTNPDDIDALVVAPNGRGVTVMSDVGGIENAFQTTTTFDDEAAGSAADAGPLRGGSVRPTNAEGADTFANPAPAPSGAALTEFDGIDPNGTWRLFVVDDKGDDAGRFEGGWSLRITTANSGPVAKGDRFVAEEGERLTVRNPGLLKNDGDADGDRLTPSITRQGTKGTARLLSGGGFVYTPKRNRTGRDTFAYQVTDAGGATATATVTIVIKPARGAADAEGGSRRG